MTDQLLVSIAQMERWKDRIYEAIHTGAVVNVSIFSSVFIWFYMFDIFVCDVRTFKGKKYIENV